MVLGVILFEETIHESAAGTVASVVALAVLMGGTAALALRRNRGSGAVWDEARQ